MKTTLLAWRALPPCMALRFGPMPRPTSPYGSPGVSRITERAPVFSTEGVSGLKDLPPDKILIKYIQEAMALTEQGVSKAKPTITAQKELHVPDYFVKVLKKDKPRVIQGLFESAGRNDSFLKKKKASA